MRALKTIASVAAAIALLPVYAAIGIWWFVREKRQERRARRR